MIPREARGQAAAPPVRSLFVYFPTGYRVGGWVTRAAGTYTDITLPAIATALNPYKAQLSLVTGTGNQPATVGNGVLTWNRSPTASSCSSGGPLHATTWGKIKRQYR